MKAMILAAGLGTRLKPVTNDIPKALVKIRDKTLLEIAINNLARNGFNEIIINIHHFAEQITGFIKKKNFKAGIRISDESDYLLDTGGGLKKAAWFFNDDKPFLIYNVDIISNLNLQAVYNHHLNSGSIATLVIRKRVSSRYLLFDKHNLLCGWKNVKTEETKTSKQNLPLTEYAFSGIHVVNTEMFSLMPDMNKFSLIDLYLNIMDDKKIAGYVDDNSFWLDVGKFASIKIAEDNYDKFIFRDF
jgi:NDP-sugar pyrophosphorylase family protein